MSYDNIVKNRQQVRAFNRMGYFINASEKCFEKENYTTSKGYLINYKDKRKIFLDILKGENDISSFEERAKSLESKLIEMEENSNE